MKDKLEGQLITGLANSREGESKEDGERSTKKLSFG